MPKSGRRSPDIYSSSITGKRQRSRKAISLFEIDPRKFKSRLKQAKGKLDQEQVSAYAKPKYDVVRNEPLAQEGAISQKEFQDCVQTSRAALASVESAAACAGSGETEPRMDESRRAHRWCRWSGQGANR